jgi:hypothetical protein
MKAKKQKLTDEPQEFTNEDHLLECFFSEKLDRFCIYFNAKLFTFKTWRGFENKRNRLIEKFDLCSTT